MAERLGSSAPDTLNGTVADDQLYGFGSSDVLNGLDGQDFLDGGTGNDEMNGGAGSDIYVVDSAADIVNEADVLGYDSVYAETTYALSSATRVERLAVRDNLSIGALNLTGNDFTIEIFGSNGVNILTGGGGNETILAFAGNDTLRGGGGNDLLDGGLGNDVMEGGAGNDRLVVDNAGDVVVELAGEGFDQVYAKVSYIVPSGAHVEQLFGFTISAQDVDLTGNDFSTEIRGTLGVNILTGGASADVLLAYAGNDMLNGNGGNDYLDGGAGSDAMNGGAGDDTYVVDNALDVVTEANSAGFDIVYATTTFTLTANSEVERLSVLDHLQTTAISLTGSDRTRDVYGNNGANVLTGGAASNVLLGFAGNDTLNGLGGDDQLLGMDGNDALEGGNGVDRLEGGIGNDYLDGGAGNDVLLGGTGDDIYIVDNSNDLITELGGEGFDIVYATGNYVVRSGASVERLSTIDDLATDAINLTGTNIGTVIRGNSGANILTGGSAADTLHGLAGADDLRGGGGGDYLDGGTGGDAMAGGDGNDTFIVDSALDSVSEGGGEGIDTVYTSVDFKLGSADIETFAAIDAAATTPLRLFGSGSANWLHGNAGDNLLDGAGGADTLTGYGGADIFNFSTFDPNAATSPVTTITDFTPGVDKIRLDTTAFLGTLGNATFFEVGAKATLATTRIVYDPTTGALKWDADGSGRESEGIPSRPDVTFGMLTAGLNLTASDFIIEANQAPQANPDAFSITFDSSGGRYWLNILANDFDVDGLDLIAYRMGLLGQPLQNAFGAVSGVVIQGTYGNIIAEGRGTSFSYQINPNDPDTLALAPGQTVTETWVYEVSDGRTMFNVPQDFELTAQAQFTISFTKMANGSLSAAAASSATDFLSDAIDAMSAGLPVSQPHELFGAGLF